MNREPRSARLPPGAPVPLPVWLDRWAERWWAATPRVRRTLVLTGIALLLVAGSVHAGSGPYGPPERVLVAARDLDVGERLSPAVLDRRDWPRDLVPAGAVSSPDGVLRAPLPRGAVATTHHIARDGIASDLPTGQVAVAVAVDLLPGIEPGTRLSLLSTHPDGRTTTVSADARALRADDQIAWIAVAEADAAAVTLAAASYALSVIVLPG